MEADQNTVTPALDEVIGEVVNRIVSAAHPRMIILFGSAARGGLGPNSDLDFLVVVDGPVHRRRLALAIYRNMIGVGFAADIVVVSTDDVSEHRQNPFTVIRPALDEGKLDYAA